MEELDCFYGCSYRATTPQFSAEKQGKTRGDQFVIEDLLDLSNEEQEDAGMASREYGGIEAMTEFSSTDSTVTTVDSCSNCVLGDPVSHFSGELVCCNPVDAGLSGDMCDPYDELAELEWLSNFVEESFSSEDLQKLQLISAPKSTSSSATHGDDSTSWTPQPPLFRQEASIPGKARSKRSRASASNWSSRLLLLSSPTNLPLNLIGDIVQSSPGKKAAKEPSTASAEGRKCLHCATDKTPQWRIGPLGPKTLCNACGVRYKSGRLVPEYRPASSPSFLISKHSNSHRKVLELRRQNELQPPQFLAPGPTALFNGAAVLPGKEFQNQHHTGVNSR